MDYKSKTPQIVSVRTRRLELGSTFKDFQQAHLPSQAVNKTEFGYDVDLYKWPIRVIHAVSATDPSLIITISLIYCNPKEFVQEVTAKMPSWEKERIQKISSTVRMEDSHAVYFVASDNNYGGEGKDYKQLPLCDVTPEITAVIESMLLQVNQKENAQK